MKLEIGQRAPSFSLYDALKTKVTIDDFSGKNILILFFPLAFTGVCTKELCSIRDTITLYNDINAQVLGISVDSLYTLNKFKEEQQLNFPLLSDFNKKVSTLYGSLYPLFGFEMEGVSKRAAFIVDKNGTIQYSEVLENAGELPNFGEINKILELLK